MSMAIARAKYTGDPGFFDFIKKAAGIATSFIPVVGGGISQAIMGIGRQPPIPTAGPGGVPLTYTQAAAGGSSAMLRYRQQRVAAGINVPANLKQIDILRSAGVNGAVFPQVPIPTALGARQRFFPLGATGYQDAPMAMNGMGGGYHLNKSDYFLMSGEFVAAGTKWVKNRKRNPANARATSRSIARIKGAKKYASSLSQITIRKKC